MTAAPAKSPTLAWLLTALTCLLAGMAIVESRHQAVALQVWATIGAVGTVEVGDSSTGTSEPTPTPIHDPAQQPVPLSTPRVGDIPGCRWGWPGAGCSTPRVEDIPVPLSNGAVSLRVTRLVVPPGVELPIEVAAGATVLLVETGSLSVQVDDPAPLGRGLDSGNFDTPLSAGGRLVIASGARYVVRNEGPTFVEALMVTIFPFPTAEPLPPSG
jgi:hypothetical protein